MYNIYMYNKLFLNNTFNNAVYYNILNLIALLIVIIYINYSILYKPDSSNGWINFLMKLLLTVRCFFSPFLSYPRKRGCTQLKVRW